jgi:hypothetical protein
MLMRVLLPLPLPPLLLLLLLLLLFFFRLCGWALNGSSWWAP